VAIALRGLRGPVGALIALGPNHGEFRPEHVHFLQSTATLFAAAVGRAAAAERLEELVRSKDEFVASISHELRTPLTVVAGMTDELNDHWQEFAPAEVDDLLGHIVDESRDMRDLIEDLLVAARADMGRVSVTLESVEVREAVDSVVSGLTARESQELTVGGAGVRAEADPVRLRQIIRNLISNAIRYGGDHIDVGIARENGHVHVTVEDDGSGIAEGQWEQVFEPYARAHDTAEQPNSVGLGLTVSRKLAQLMGGDLEYRYEDRSVFDLTLPATAGPGDRSGSVEHSDVV
jgi:signal transduction histidine kinase